MSAFSHIVLQCAHLVLCAAANRSTLCGLLLPFTDGVLGGVVPVGSGVLGLLGIPTNCSNESIYKFDGKFSMKFWP